LILLYLFYLIEITVIETSIEGIALFLCLFVALDYIDDIFVASIRGRFEAVLRA